MRRVFPVQDVTPLAPGGSNRKMFGVGNLS